MTNKEFVKTIYPDATCRLYRCLPNEYYVYESRGSIVWGKLISWGNTPNQAWRWARVITNYRIIDKWES